MDKIFCVECGKPNNIDGVFCTACGARLVKPTQTVPMATQPMPTQQLPARPVAQPAYTQQQAMRTHQPGQYGYAEAPKKHGNGIIIALVVIVVLAALAIGGVLIYQNFLAKPQVVASASAEPAASVAPASSGASAPAANGGADKPGSAVVSGQSSAEASSSASASSASAPAASEYVLPESNSRYYSRSELEKYSNRELYYARNEIYARHGRGFKNQDLRDYFASKSWYEERYSPEQFDSMASPLNDYERKNAELMLEIEQSRNSPYL